MYNVLQSSKAVLLKATSIAPRPRTLVRRLRGRVLIRLPILTLLLLYGGSPERLDGRESLSQPAYHIRALEGWRKCFNASDEKPIAAKWFGVLWQNECETLCHECLKTHGCTIVKTVEFYALSFPSEACRKGISRPSIPCTWRNFSPCQHCLQESGTFFLLGKAQSVASPPLLVSTEARATADYSAVHRIM